MSGYEHFNFPAFDKGASLVAAWGHECVSPAEIDREVFGWGKVPPADLIFSESDFAETIRRDYRELTQVDAIAFLPGWQDSRGASLERRFGLQLGLPFYRFDPTINMLDPEVIVGFTGYARSGKDTAAAKAVADFGFERIGWADSLKGVLLALNPIVAGASTRLSDYREDHETVDEFWEFVKDHNPEVRTLLQRLGTEGGRTHISDDVWVRALIERQHGTRVVIPDCRFENEAAAVRSRHGIIIEVVRPGVGPANAHVSERCLEGDVTIHNDSTIEALHKQVADVLLEHLASRRIVRA
jgi:hypothetical protein